MKSLSFALACAVLVTAAPGQLLNVTVTNPVPIGSPVTVTAFDAYNGGLFTPFGCLLSGIYDAPGGNVVAIFPCTFLGVPIPACNSGMPPRTQTWAGTMTPGRYWIEISHSVGPFGPITNEYYCVDIFDPAQGPPAALTAVNTPTIGTNFQMSINSPSDAGATYILALSGSSNVGAPIAPGLSACIDVDPLFNLTYPSPVPGIFNNFQSTLDATGTSVGISVNIPNDPALACMPVHAQALILGVNWRTTNDLLINVQ